MKKPHILITNDDGITAKGIWHLWHALKDHAHLSIVAPSSQRSGASLGLTLHKPITITPYQWENQTPAWEVTGTPADCVRFGLRYALKQTPDLIVSGINRGSNSGRSVLYSGTVGGVIEGALRQIPGIAFSSTDMATPKYEMIEPHVLPLVHHLLEHPLTVGTILNVNFPTEQDRFRGVKLARQGKGLIQENPQERTHPDGNTYYWHGGQWAHHDEHEESDVTLLEQGYVAAVPIHVSELTDHELYEKRKAQFDTHFEK